jgi:quercetin dioxygenase-like cupin family protein
MDVFIVGWEPGQSSSFHNHGASESIVYMLEGSITSNPGRPDEKVVRAGDLVVTPRGTWHQMKNHTSSRAVGLHVYGPNMATNRKMSEPFRDFRAEVLARTR